MSTHDDKSDPVRLPTVTERRGIVGGELVRLVPMLVMAIGLSACVSPNAQPTTPSASTVASSTTVTAPTTSVTTTSVATMAAGESSATTSVEEDRFDCVVGPVPSEAGLDPFYTQGCSLDGFWVVAGEPVDPEALERAADLVAAFFRHDEELARHLASTGVRMGVIGATQQTTDMPEYHDLNEVFPEVDWNIRARGLGATVERPLVSAGEENLLCLSSDRYLGEDILLHEFSHVLDEFGYSALDPTFNSQVLAAYIASLDEGTWDSTYAAENEAEYWAEAVQSYFNRNLSFDPADGIHGPIGTREALAAADPAIFDLIDQRMAGITLPSSCHPE